MDESAAARHHAPRPPCHLGEELEGAFGRPRIAVVEPHVGVAAEETEDAGEPVDRIVGVGMELRLTSVQDVEELVWVAGLVSEPTGRPISIRLIDVVIGVVRRELVEDAELGEPAWVRLVTEAGPRTAESVGVQRGPEAGPRMSCRLLAWQRTRW